MKHVTEKIPCTVTVLTFNNEKTLTKCLDSVTDFAEIIICDGGSTDETLKIARQFGCKVITQDKQFKYDDDRIADFSGIRNQTIEAASYRWYVYIDSDEYLSPELVKEIRKIVTSDFDERGVVYNMPRKYVFQGKMIDCAFSYPNYHTRFFHLDYVVGFRKNVHEKLVLKDGVVKVKLKHPSYVPISIDFEKEVKKQDYYLDIEKKRFEELTVRQTLRGLLSTIKDIFSRILRLVWSTLFCRGNRLPFQRFILGMRYHIKLSMILIILLFKHIFK